MRAIHMTIGVLLASCHTSSDDLDKLVRDTSGYGLATGHIESTGPTGTWVLDHANCYSGEPRGFFGALIQPKDGSGISVKLVKDPVDNSWAMAVNEADTCKEGSGKDCKATLFHADVCKAFDIDLKMHQTSSRRLKIFDGTAHVDCTSHGGSHVVGDLTLKACQN